MRNGQHPGERKAAARRSELHNKLNCEQGKVPKRAVARPAQRVLLRDC